jgi:hypothetical protein
MNDTANLALNRKVLLFDLDDRRREIRAGNLRMRGADVLCARNLEELRSVWQAETFRLILLEAGDCPEAITFSEEVRLSDRRQRLAFFVGKPKYLAFLPVSIDDGTLPIHEIAELVSVEDACKSLNQRNGFMEASLRMQLARASRRGAATVHLVKSPWDALKGPPDA